MAATFTVEDGTGLAEANSLCTTAFADQYHENHGNPSVWSALSADEKEAALRIGTRYITAVYESRLPGYRKTSTQRLPFPISGGAYTDGYAISDTSVPREAQEACALAGLKSAEGTLVHGTVTAPAPLRKKVIKIDVIRIENEWVSGESSLPRFDDINGAMRRLVTAPGLLERG